MNDDPICNERGIPESECQPFCPHDFGPVVGNAEYGHDGLRTRIAALRDEWATEGASLVRNCSTGRDVNEGEQMQACARALTNLLAAEFQDDALEMARKADAAERRAEEAEFHVEQLRDARDRAERRAEKLEAVICQVKKVFDLQCPPMLPEKYVDRGAWMAHSWWNTVLGSILRRTERATPEVPCPVCGGSMRFCECMDDPFTTVPDSDDAAICDCGEPVGLSRSCDHEWLDRPESDTRECLTCGTEVAG